MPASHLHRRQFLQFGAVAVGLASPIAAAWACRENDAPGRPPPSPKRAAAPTASAKAGPTCAITDANIEGPYYRAGAPLRSNLLDADVSGVALLLTGRVLSLDCRSPLSNAELDIWHADDLGHYDNDGSLHLPADRFRLRGRIKTDKNGAFSLSSIVPGRYLNGKVYRPAHVHVKVVAAGHQGLTTQLYFPGDPFNDVDPFISRSLIMDVAAKGDGKQAHFDFVLPPVPKQVNRERDSW